MRIAASALATDCLSIHDRRDPLWLQAAQDSAQRAYRQAGVGPADIDLFELHDAFTIMARPQPGSRRLCRAGQGLAWPPTVKSGPAGAFPSARMGGLKARGHPVGATGVYQIVEAVQQLRGEAGDCQVPGARRA